MIALETSTTRLQVVFFAIGFVLIIGALAALFMPRVRGSITTRGKVIAHKSGPDAENVSTDYMVIKWVDETGRSHTFRTSLATNVPTWVGGTVRVHYRPGDPASARVGRHFGTWVLSSLAILAGSVSIWLGYLLF